MITVYHGDCLEWLPELGQFDMTFADPPDNINRNYKGFVDKIEHYDVFLWKVLAVMFEHAPISWMSFNAKWFDIVGKIANQLFPNNHRFFIQTFTFGNNRRKDFVNGYRPIIRLMRNDAVTYPKSVYVESWRQKHGDKRAAKGGKMPDDVWDIPRVTGNSKQRRSWSDNQLHESLYKRCIDFSTKPGDRICDLFCGSGTMGRVAGETHDVHLIDFSRPTLINVANDLVCDVKWNDKLPATIFGVGINDSNYKIFDCPIYRRWYGMIRRCYDSNFHIKNPSYQLTKVYQPWHRFSVFSQWMSSQSHADCELDKDILGDGKLYSPQTCCFIPRRINTLLNQQINQRSKYGIGVSKRPNGKFQSHLTVNGKLHTIGTFTTAKEGEIAYRAAKIKYAQSVLENFDLSPNILTAIYLKLENIERRSSD